MRALGAIAGSPRSGHCRATRFRAACFPRPLALGAAPALGWAVHSAATLPLLTLIGFSPLAVAGTGALCVIAAGVSLTARAAEPAAEPASRVPAWSWVAAALLALAPASAIVPKFSATGVHLADPIFDHSKIAIIDAMTRQDLPPINPVFGQFGAAGHLTYYYLWHFSAAQLALPLGESGWEADIGLTWFTAFASLTLMMGLAVWLGRRSVAAILVVLLAAARGIAAQRCSARCSALTRSARFLAGAPMASPAGCFRPHGRPSI